MSWWKQPARHALAAKGIQSRSSAAVLDRLGRKGVAPCFGRAGSYERSIKKIAEQQSGSDENISGETYEEVIQPLFVTLEEADELANQGDYRNSADRLDVAGKQLESMQRHCNIITSADAQDFARVVHAVTAKNVAGSRMKTLQQAKAMDKPVAAVSQPNVDDKSRGYHDSD